MKLINLGIIFLMYAPMMEAAQLKPLEILKSSDLARGGLAQGMSWNVSLYSNENGIESTRGFFVQAKDVNALVDAKSPERNLGEVYLFNDRTMWFFKPSIKKPISISARQKLTGQAANGDIASTNYSRDYNPTLERIEKAGSDNIYVLFLQAKSTTMTYDKIRYWISEQKRLAIKAEFLTLQGTPFKVAQFQYKNSFSYNGKSMPFISEMKIQDAKNPRNYSVMRYASPKIEDVSDSIFNVNNLKR